MRPQMLATVLRAATRPTLTTAARTAPVFTRPSSSAHAQETFEAFSDRYVNFFQNAEDLFEVQRGLNNCFAHDLVPSPAVVESALRAARRVNDYATAVRIFEGIREKVENKQQYQSYLDELKGVRDELGVSWSDTCFAWHLIRVLRHLHEGRPFHIAMTPLDGDRGIHLTTQANLLSNSFQRRLLEPKIKFIRVP